MSTSQRDFDHARHLAREQTPAVFRFRDPLPCSRCSTPQQPGQPLLLVPAAAQPDTALPAALCLPCANLAHLEFLPSGDTALTRRATKLSALHFLVLEWSKAGKRYERRGTLLDPAAIADAKVQCEADAAVRQVKQHKAAAKREVQDRQYLALFTAELKRLFPSCPPPEAEQIALHACEKHSGRVGRSAAAKDLDPEKITLAVVAHIRHIHTGYDQFFDLHLRKHEARRLVQNKITRILTQWQAPADVLSPPQDDCVGSK